MIDYTTLEEQKLLGKIAAGDQRAFEELVQRFADLLHAFLLRHTANKTLTEEIVQDIFTQIWQTRETLTTIRNFRSFLFVISRNYAWDQLKKQSRGRRRHQEWVEDNRNADLPEEELYDERIGLIEMAINQLPPRQLEVWTMSRRQQLTYASIATRLGLSRETVKSYLQLANASIIRFVHQHGEFLLFIFVVKNILSDTPYTTAHVVLQ